MTGRNFLIMGGALLEVAPRRVTPAGVAVTEGKLLYSAQVKENGLARTLEFEMPFLAMGEVADRLIAEPLGTEIEATGFLAPKTLKIARLVMHITEYKKGA